MGNGAQNYLVLFLLGMTGIWKAVPVGIAIKAHPLVIFGAATAGASTTVFLLHVFGVRVKAFISKRIGSTRYQRKQSWMRKLLDKYGVIGLGLMGPLLLGPYFTVGIGLMLLKPGSRLVVWTVAGVVIWTAVLTAASAMGVNLISTLIGGRWHVPGAPF